MKPGFCDECLHRAATLRLDEYGTTSEWEADFVSSLSTTRRIRFDLTVTTVTTSSTGFVGDGGCGSTFRV